MYICLHLTTARHQTHGDIFALPSRRDAMVKFYDISDPEDDPHTIPALLEGQAYDECSYLTLMPRVAFAATGRV